MYNNIILAFELREYAGIRCEKTDLALDLSSTGSQWNYQGNFIGGAALEAPCLYLCCVVLSVAS